MGTTIHRAVTASLIACAPLSMAQAQSGDLVEFKSVPQAMAALKAKPGVTTTSTSDGWTIFAEGPRVLWTFGPANHVAGPAAIRRALVRDAQGKLAPDMKVYCDAPKHACDQFVSDFEALNERLRRGEGREGERK